MKVFLVFLCFVAIDLVTGNVLHVYKGDWTSSKMREGLFHKFAEVVMVLTLMLMNYAIPQVIGQSLVITLFNVSFTLDVALEVLFIFMEIGSIKENLVAINPAMKSTVEKVTSVYEKDGDE